MNKLLHNFNYICIRFSQSHTHFRSQCLYISLPHSKQTLTFAQTQHRVKYKCFTSTLYHLTPFLSNIHSFRPSTKDNSTLYHLTPFLSNIHSFTSSTKDNKLTMIPTQIFRLPLHSFFVIHSLAYQSIQSIPKLGLTIWCEVMLCLCKS